MTGSAEVSRLAWAKTLVLIGSVLALYLGTAMAAFALGAGVVGAACAANAVTFAAVITWRRMLAPEFLDAPRPAAQISSLSFWVWVTTALASCWLAGQVLADWLYQRFGSSSFDQIGQIRAQESVALLALTTLLLAPAGEEALMRGAVYPLLRRHWPPLAAAFCSSAVFSIMHGNLVQAAVSFPLGMLLALLYEHVQRLWPVVLVHVLFNAAAVLVPATVVAGIATLPVVLASWAVVAVTLTGMLPPAGTKTASHH